MSALSLQNATSRRGGWSGGSGGGAITGGSNAGAGVGVFKAVSGTNLVFKSLMAGAAISLTPGTDTITIDTSAESNTASNLGAGAGLFSAKVGADLQFKSIVAGSGLSVTPGANSIALAVSNPLPSGTDNYFPFWSGGTLTTTSQLLNSSGNLLFTRLSPNPTGFTVQAQTSSVACQIALSNLADGKSSAITFDPQADIVSVGGTRVQLRTGFSTSFLDLQSVSLTYTGGDFTVTRTTAATALTVTLRNGTTGRDIYLVFNNSADATTASLTLYGGTNVVELSGNTARLQGSINSQITCTSGSSSLVLSTGSLAYTGTLVNTDAVFSVVNGTSGKISSIVLSNSAQSRNATISFDSSENKISIVGVNIDIGSLATTTFLNMLGSSINLANSTSSLSLQLSTWQFLESDVTITRGNASISDTILRITAQATGKSQQIIFRNAPDAKQASIAYDPANSSLTITSSPGSVNLTASNNVYLTGADIELINPGGSTSLVGIGTQWSFRDGANNYLNFDRGSGGITFGLMNVDGDHRIVPVNGELVFQFHTGGIWVTDIGYYSSISSGTGYTLTSSYAQVAFGTTTPQITLARPGSYLVMVRAWTKSVSGSFLGKTNPGFWFKVYRSNNTPSDIANTENFISTNSDDAATGATMTFGTVTHATVYTTANTTDILQIYGKIQTTVAAGSFQVYSASIMAVRLR